MNPTESLLPPLREELSIHPGPNARDGSPTWVLHDPLSNRFFHIGYFEFEILFRWGLGSPDAIVRSLEADTTLTATGEDIEAVVLFLAANNLLKIRGESAIDRLMRQSMAKRVGLWRWLLKNYLFIRIPLVRPDRFLAATISWVSWLWSGPVVLMTVCCGGLGLLMLLHQWDRFLSTFPFFFSLEGIILMGLTLNFAKVMHEFGHAYAAKRFGCRVSSMGIAFLVLFPVLFTDVSDAWKLPSRKQRLIIGSAGMVTELALASYATLAWSFLPDGPWRSAAFLLASTTWVATLLVNLSPFMRFDGYYLFSDILGVPNLQERAFALGRWRLREALFGFGETAPEHMTPALRRTIILYAYATWMYRFFLFLSIALLVYYLFFKALGIVLMGVEVVYFILAPIVREMLEWKTRRRKLRLNRNTVAVLTALFLFLGLVFFPWRATVTAPALWRAAQYSRVFVPFPSRVEAIGVAVGSRVTSGEELLRLSSPDLDHEIGRIETRITSFSWQVKFQGMSAELKDKGAVFQRELETAQAELRERMAERDKLVIKSDLNGVVAEMMEPITIGDWLPANDLLAVVLNPDVGIVEAYVNETDLARIQKGVRGRFFPDDVGQPPFAVIVQSVDAFTTRSLPEMYHASLYGGAIAVRELPVNNGRQLVPEIPIYRLVLVPVSKGAAPTQVVRGMLSMDGERISLVVGIWQKVAGVLVREMGF